MPATPLIDSGGLASPGLLSPQDSGRLESPTGKEMAASGSENVPASASRFRPAAASPLVRLARLTGAEVMRFGDYAIPARGAQGAANGVGSGSDCRSSTGESASARDLVSEAASRDGGSQAVSLRPSTAEVPPLTLPFLHSTSTIATTPTAPHGLARSRPPPLALAPAGPNGAPAMTPTKAGPVDPTDVVETPYGRKYHFAKTATTGRGSARVLGEGAGAGVEGRGGAVAAVPVGVTTGHGGLGGGGGTGADRVHAGGATATMATPPGARWSRPGELVSLMRRAAQAIAHTHGPGTEVGAGKGVEGHSGGHRKAEASEGARVDVQEQHKAGAGAGEGVGAGVDVVSVMVTGSGVAEERRRSVGTSTGEDGVAAAGSSADKATMAGSEPGPRGDTEGGGEGADEDEDLARLEALGVLDRHALQWWKLLSPMKGTGGAGVGKGVGGSPAAAGVSGAREGDGWDGAGSGAALEAQLARASRESAIGTPPRQWRGLVGHAPPIAPPIAPPLAPPSPSLAMLPPDLARRVAELSGRAALAGDASASLSLSMADLGVADPAPSPALADPPLLPTYRDMLTSRAAQEMAREERSRAYEWVGVRGQAVRGAEGGAAWGRDVLGSGLMPGGVVGHDVKGQLKRDVGEVRPTAYAGTLAAALTGADSLQSLLERAEGPAWTPSREGFNDGSPAQRIRHAFHAALRDLEDLSRHVGHGRHGGHVSTSPHVNTSPPLAMAVAPAPAETAGQRWEGSGDATWGAVVAASVASPARGGWGADSGDGPWTIERALLGRGGDDDFDAALGRAAEAVQRVRGAARGAAAAAAEADRYGMAMGAMERWGGVRESAPRVEVAGGGEGGWAGFAAGAAGGVERAWRERAGRGSAAAWVPPPSVEAPLFPATRASFPHPRA